MQGKPPGRPRGRRTPELLHKHTAARLRAEYRKQWGQDWPHDDRYLKQLWDETKTADRLNQRHELVQTAMRECDTTIPASYGAPTAEDAAESADDPHAGADDV